MLEKIHWHTPWTLKSEVPFGRVGHCIEKAQSEQGESGKQYI
jgi:hypothetical protein